VSAPEKDIISPSGYRPMPDFFKIICQTAAILTVLMLGWIIYEIIESAWPAIQKYGLDFVTTSAWVPNRDRFGVLPFIVGTLASSLLAILLAFPLGVAIAIFLSENFLSPAIRQTMRFVVEMLAAIPSVVYGLWGIFVIIPIVKAFGDWAVDSLGGFPLFSGPAYGNSLLTASVVLALWLVRFSPYFWHFRWAWRSRSS